jgi:hypothetical protein
MARTPKLRAKTLKKTFRKIERQIEPQTDPLLGAYLVRLAKEPEEMARFREHPEAAMQAAGVSTKLVDAAVLQRVAQSVIDRLVEVEIPHDPGEVFDAVTERETHSSQEKNFDNSSSWFTNKDGYNVMHEAGHSSEQSTGEMVGQDTKFDGLGLHHFDEVIRHKMNDLFYPSQPLVAPELIDKIRAAIKDMER